MSTALITGATAGIGAAFARYLAADRHDLVLVARGAERLSAAAEQLNTAHGVDVSVIAADLATKKGCNLVAERAAEVDLLINNAGIGLSQRLTSATVTELDRVLDVNVRAVQRLTRAALPAMMERGHGAIVNVSSVAGFIPTVPGSTYSASKAWVTDFSESMALLARRRGVAVMALCPGLVRTEFHASAGIPTDGFPDWLWLSADYVVEVAMRDLRRKKVICVPSSIYKICVSAIRHTPLNLRQLTLNRAMEFLRGKSTTGNSDVRS